MDYGCFAPVQAFVEVFKHFGIEPTMEEVREAYGNAEKETTSRRCSIWTESRSWLEKYGRR